MPCGLPPCGVVLLDGRKEDGRLSDAVDAVPCILRMKPAPWKGAERQMKVHLKKLLLKFTFSIIGSFWHIVL